MKASISVADAAAKAATKSAKVAEDALLVGERPYVFVVKVEFSEPLTRETFDYEGDPVWPFVKFTLENHGRTPASIVEICADSACVAQLPAIPAYRGNATYQIPHLLGADKAIVLGYLFKTPIDGQVMNDIGISPDIAEGARRLFAFGYVKYTDIFDYVTIVGFCWRYNLGLKAFISLEPDEAKHHEAYIYRKSDPPPAKQPAC